MPQQPAAIYTRVTGLTQKKRKERERVQNPHENQ